MSAALIGSAAAALLQSIEPQRVSPKVSLAVVLQQRSYPDTIDELMSYLEDKLLSLSLPKRELDDSANGSWQIANLYLASTSPTPKEP